MQRCILPAAACIQIHRLLFSPGAFIQAPAFLSSLIVCNLPQAAATSTAIKGTVWSYYVDHHKSDAIGYALICRRCAKLFIVFFSIS